MNPKVCFESALKELGFRQRGTMLLKSAPPLTFMVKAARSRYAPSYEIDLGVVHSAVPCESLNVPLNWHLSSRIDEVIPESIEIRKAMDERTPMSDDHRTEVIQRAAEAVDSLFRDRWGSEEYLFQLGRKPFDPMERIHKRFRDYVAELP